MAKFPSFNFDDFWATPEKEVRRRGGGSVAGTAGKSKIAKNLFTKLELPDFYETKKSKYLSRNYND